MMIPAKVHRYAYALALGLPALALAVAALGQGGEGPACVELADDDSPQPGLSSLADPAPTPACIRVRLAEVR